MLDRTHPPVNWAASCALTSDNRIVFEVWHARISASLPRPLPKPVVEPRPEGVFVFLCDLDDLDLWCEAVGGVVERGPAFGLVRPWTLTVNTGPECGGLMVYVSVLALVDAHPLQALVDAHRLAQPLSVLDERYRQARLDEQRHQLHDPAEPDPAASIFGVNQPAPASVVAS